jgi:glycosyltransferase involved in cell wall biosynthesis
MHIVVLTPLYPGPKTPHKGTFVYQQIQALSKRHQITVIAPVLATSKAPSFGCEVFKERNWQVYHPRCWYVPGVWSALYVPVVFWCTRDLEWDEVDLIHAHFSIPTGFTGIWLSRWYRKPLVLTEHTGDFEFWTKSPARRWGMYWTMKRADRLIVVSHDLKRRIISAGFHANFSVVPNIVDTKEFHQSSGPKRENGIFNFLWVGRFEDRHYYTRKGGPELLQAIARARSELELHRSVLFTLVGDGHLRAAVETEAARLGISDICRFVGRLSHLEVRDQMQECDALVAPSRSESFGVVLIEAMACGKPVLSTYCGGPEEIVTPKTGVLVSPNDPAALAKGMVRMVESYDVFNSQDIASYARKNFNPDSIAEMLVKIYVEACESQVGDRGG